MVLVTLIPLVNLLSVMVLTRFAGSAGVGYRQMIKPIITNPLIIACVLGAALNFSGLGLPFLMDELLGLLGRAALPVGLLVVGAGLDLALLRFSVIPILTASAFKLVIFPMLTALLCNMLGLSSNAQMICVTFTALPCAPSAYILAMELGGDTRLMAAVLTGQTILAVVSMPLIILWLG